MVAGIVDQYGNAISSRELASEFAAPQEFGRRRVIEDAVATALVPESLAQILREAATGEPRRYLTLAMEMEERYLHYASQVQTRRLAIEGIDATVEAPDGVAPRIVDAVKELVEDGRFATLRGEATDGIAKGYAVHEIMWEVESRLLKPVEYIFRDQRFFGFDRATMSDLRLLDDTASTWSGSGYGMEGLPLPPAKFIVHVPRSRVGIPIRRGIARPAAWAFMVQSFGLQDWAAFAEIYGVPFRLGRYGTNASDADKRTLLQAVRAIANDGAAVVPKGTEIEFQKVEGSHGAAVFGGLMEYTDKQVSKLVLGQTMTADDGASMAQAKVHNEVRIDILRADGRQLADTLNRDVIEPFVAMNFGPQSAYPRLELNVPEPEDIEALTKAVQVLVPLGFRVSQAELRDRIGLSDPGEDEEVLVPPTAAPAPVAAGSSGRRSRAPGGTGAEPARKPAGLAAGEPTRPRIDTDALLDDVMADAMADWTQVSEPLLAPFAAILDDATSIEDARRMLEKMRSGSRPLADRLAAATAIARGLGDVADPPAIDDAD